MRATRNRELAVQWTSRLDRCTAKYQSIRHAPVLFQEQVPKKLELRVNVVGRKVFAAAIESQENVRISGDWRHYPELTPLALLRLDAARGRRKLCVRLSGGARTVPGRDRSHPHSLGRVCIPRNQSERPVDLHRGIHRSPDRGCDRGNADPRRGLNIQLSNNNGPEPFSGTASNKDRLTTGAYTAHQRVSLKGDC